MLSKARCADTAKESTSTGEYETCTPPANTTEESKLCFELRRPTKMCRTTIKETIKQDRFDLFGAVIAAKLRDMSKRQRILAEKYINEIVADGEMDRLTATLKFVETANLNTWQTSPGTSNPMYNSTPTNYYVSYAPQMTQPIQLPYTPHQVHIQQPQAVSVSNNPAVVEISIPETASNYWANFT